MSTPWLFILLTNPTFNFPPPTWSFLLDNCPAIPELIGATGDSGGNAVGGTAASRNPVSAARARRAAEDHANAVAAAAGVSEINFGPGEKKKQKRHTDTQDIIDDLFSHRLTEASNLEAMVGNLAASLKGSPGKQKKDKVEQLNRLINQYETSAKNKKDLGMPYGHILEKIEKLEAERDALA